MTEVTRLVIAQQEAAHYRELADLERQMVMQMSDVLWAIVLELGLPPDMDLGDSTLFGMYNSATVLNAVKRLTRPHAKAKHVPKG